MAKVTSRTEGIRGVDQRLYPEPNTMRNLNMVRLDQNGGWTNDVGWEPQVQFLLDEYVLLPEDLQFSPCRFLGIWSRHQNAEVYYLHEVEGRLQYYWGNFGNYSFLGDVVLDTDRPEPKADDCGTQLIPYGRFALLVNGASAPIKFWGRARVEGFGWSSPPSPPTVLTPQPSALNASFVSAGSTCIRIGSASSLFGVGDGANGDTNTYAYRYAWISNTGSISPPSAPTFVAWSIENTSEAGKQAVMLRDLATGPEGTVAHVIYRTKNLRDSNDINLLETFYEVARIEGNHLPQWVDHLPDSMLSAVPVDLQASVPIDTAYKVGAEFDGRLWLAGGSAHPTRIIWSEAGAPEQFALGSYFELGSRVGGKVSALVPYYNALLVFRNAAVDVITKLSSGQYQISTLDSSIGTDATNSIREVPGVGVMFLTKEGVYVVTGGLYGGSTLRVEAIGAPLSEEWKRLSLAALARASATYSPKEQEYWVSYAVDGNTECSRGAVYHLQSGGWSLRHGDGPQGLRFTQLATDPWGWIVIGTNPIGRPTTWGDMQPADIYPGWGLQVWSYGRSWGSTFTASSSGTGFVASDPVFSPAGESTWTSQWEDLSDLDLQKAGIRVKAEGLSRGAYEIPLSWSTDYGYEQTAVATGAGAIDAKTYGGPSAQKVFCTAAAPFPRGYAIWDTSRWEGPRRMIYRWDLGTPKASTMRWEVKTSRAWHLLKYAVESMVSNTRTPNSKG